VSVKVKESGLMTAHVSINGTESGSMAAPVSINCTESGRIVAHMSIHVANGGRNPRASRGSNILKYFGLVWQHFQINQGEKGMVWSPDLSFDTTFCLIHLN